MPQATDIYMISLGDGVAVLMHPDGDQIESDPEVFRFIGQQVFPDHQGHFVAAQDTHTPGVFLFPRPEAVDQMHEAVKEGNVKLPELPPDLAAAMAAQPAQEPAPEQDPEQAFGSRPRCQDLHLLSLDQLRCVQRLLLALTEADIYPRRVAAERTDEGGYVPRIYLSVTDRYPHEMQLTYTGTAIEVSTGPRQAHPLAVSLGDLPYLLATIHTVLYGA